MHSYRQSPYDKLPHDLRELIDSTNEGVERLYNAAEGAAVPTRKKKKSRHTTTQSRGVRVMHMSSDSEYDDEMLPDRHYHESSSRNRPLRRGRASSNTGTATPHQSNWEANATTTPERLYKGTGQQPHHNNHTHNNNITDASSSFFTYYASPLAQSRPMGGGGGGGGSAAGSHTTVTAVAMDSSNRTQHTPTAGCSLVEQRRRRRANSSTVTTASRNADTTRTTDGGGSHHTGGASHMSDDAMRTEFGMRWRNTLEHVLAPKSEQLPAATAALPSTASTQTAPQSASVVPAEQQLPADPIVGEPRAESSALSNSAIVAQMWVDKLKAELKEKDAEVLSLRLAHAKEVAELREAVAEARAAGGRDASEQLASSYAVKETVLKSAVESESQRLGDCQHEVRSLTHELAQCRSKLLETETEAARLRRQEEERKAIVQKEVALRQELVEVQAAKQRAEAALSAAQDDVARGAAAEATLSQQVQELEDRLHQHEESAKRTLHQLEEEFTATTNSYQELLSQATKRLGHLEKIQRKYKALKETHSTTSRGLQDITDTYEARRHEWEVERSKLRSEVAALKEQLANAEQGLRDLSETHETALEELRRQSDAQKNSAGEQTEVLKRQVETSQHTIQLLKTQIESLKQEVAEEQAHSQELAMRMAEKELHLQQEKQSQQKSAAAYKVQSEETLASVKRQLREKDAQLKALAASQNEPLQRLRSQLEDERSRRAQIEQQFTQYKRKAKEAEENALREVRREQLRTNEFFASPSGRLHTASTSGGTKGGRSSASSVAAVSPPTPSTTPTKGGQKKERLFSPHSAVTSVRVSTASPRSSVSRSPNTHGAGGYAAAASASATAGADAAAGNSPPQLQTTSIGLPIAPMTSTHPNLVVRSMSPPREADREYQQKNKLSQQQQQQHDKSGSVYAPGVGAASISAISHNSPCNSTGQLDSDAAPLLLQDMDADRAGRREDSCPREPSARRTATPLISPREADTLHLDGEEEDGHDALHMLPAGAADHERRMRGFHASAAEVFRRITGSREEFMAQCAAIVRQSGDTMRRSRRTSLGNNKGNDNNNEASSNESSQEDEDEVLEIA